MARSEKDSLFLASKQIALGDEKSAFMQVLERTWSDESEAANNMMKAPNKVKVLNFFHFLIFQFSKRF